MNRVWYAANRDFGALTPNQTPNAANFVPLTPDGFLPFIDTTLEDYAGTAGIRGEVAGWRADFSIGTGHNRFDYMVRNSLNTSFGTASQSEFDAGGLRYGQTVANLDFSRQYEIGLATPLSVALGAEYRNENFGIRPGETQSWAAGPLFRAAFATTSANCTTQGGVFNAGTSVCSFPGRQAAVGAQGFPGIPTVSATDESRHSFAAACPSRGTATSFCPPGTRNRVCPRRCVIVCGSVVSLSTSEASISPVSAATSAPQKD